MFEYVQMFRYGKLVDGSFRFSSGSAFSIPDPFSVSSKNFPVSCTFQGKNNTFNVPDEPPTTSTFNSLRTVVYIDYCSPNGVLRN